MQSSETRPVQPSQSSQQNPLSFLRTLPQFSELQQSIQHNPALLQMLLEQLGQTNPELLRVSYDLKL